MTKLYISDHFVCSVDERGSSALRDTVSENNYHTLQYDMEA